MSLSLTRWSYMSRVPSTTYQYDVPGLITGRQYMIHVRPQNLVGLGEAIKPDTQVTQQAKYSTYLLNGWLID
jgi:hypothetical protein